MGIAHEDVVWGFRLLLGREPESPEIVDQFATALGTRWELVRALLRSQEFQARNPLNGSHTSDSCVVITEMEPGLRLFVDLSDTVIGLNIARKSFEPSEAAFIKRALGPGQVMLDIGANIGFYAMLSASLAGPEGHVYAFEPVPANADLLERSVRENAFEARVTLSRAVVGDRSGLHPLVHLPLHRNPGGNSGGSYLAAPGTPPPRDHDMLQVPMLRLDEMDLRRPVDFVKIDVEGAEPLVFRGARRLLAHDRPLILAEVNPPQLAKVSDCSVRQLLDEMAALEYQCLELREDLLLQPFEINGSEEGSLRSVVFAPFEARLPVSRLSA